MEVKDYQEFTKTTAVYPFSQDDPRVIELLYLGNGLAGEAGEVSNLIKKFHRDGWSHEKQDKLLQEMGDVFWYLSQMCNQVGVTLGDVMRINSNKLSGRLERGTIRGSGDDR